MFFLYKTDRSNFMTYLSDLRVHTWNGRNVIPPYYVSLYTFRIWQQYNLISGNDSGFPCAWKIVIPKDASLARLQMLQPVIKQVYKCNDGIEVSPNYLGFDPRVENE